ncbi:ectonucleoside triphosphate diphosphohydrolase 1-like isoform X2 [Haliotis rufescens]|uniref:ectonucleoside triphosphate diphosphohydrolase 1-like isoform X1 n=2 Tax=Haliotis rufescens TaxID=6454 RepID=UPI00201EF927|nr:ectonucleoside triphosphate diphosphohydrolase 1-like isoform X1 [Haliotis rufescens]XP_046334454.2 ectonucleoside triphosphate diphosphohydrolase 1-like isoform X1 [Haliotis rufescens]XP_048249467.1 ectonucleoside triphosphate diphosphohydrolase 1-like isoform X2 [Haliotis rufescens]
MEDGGNEIEVVVQSVLAPGCPQGRFPLQVPSNISVEGLMRRVCKDANVPLLPHYVLKNARNEVLPSLETLNNLDVINGSVLHWDDDDLSTKTSVKGWCNTWWFMCLIAFFIGAIGLVAISIIKSKESAVAYSYGIVFDAGSSHTSMYIYQWNGAKLNETAVASQFGEPVTPPVAGISHFTTDTTEGRHVVKICLDAAQDRIPRKNWKKTPVYLGATAGMRMLNEVNKTISNEILAVIRKAISEYSFITSDDDALIITGEEEGAFSWITSNYVEGTFHVTPPTSNMLSENMKPKTTGALDMGGASAQISFIPNMTVPQGYSRPVELYGHNYTLYTHSFLCYGINEALRRYRAALVQSQNFSVEINDPCAPAGWKSNFTHDALFQAPCVGGQHAVDTFGSRIIPDVYLDDDTVFLFSGASDVEKCQSFVADSLFNFSAQCDDSPCSFNGVFQPPVVGDFYAFSTFYYVTNFLNLTDGTKAFTLPDFHAAIDGFCNKTWQEVEVMPAAKKSALPSYCFQSNFIDIILTRGYGFDTSNWNNLHFVEKVANTKIGWSLGFMLNKSNGIPVNEPQNSISTVTFVLLTVLFALFILAAVGFACHARLYRAAKAKRKYTRLAEYGSI